MIEFLSTFVVGGVGHQFFNDFSLIEIKIRLPAVNIPIVQNENYL